MRTYVVGNCNTQALIRALPDYDGPLDLTIDFLAIKDADPWREPSYRLKPAYFGKKLAAPLVVSMLGGGLHTAIGLIAHPIPFDFEMPGHPPPEPGERRLIPYHQLHEMFDISLRRQFVMLASLRKMVSGRLVHLQPQPPIASEAHIRANPGSYAQLIEQGITPAPIRLKLWALESLILTTICAELDVELIPFPAEAIDPNDGCLREDLRHRDATHCNTRFGHIALDHITRLALPMLQRNIDRPPAAGASSPQAETDGITAEIRA